jgi:MYXO-CTERM domain-containing protein
MKGDFNFDGRVNLFDWEILNELAPPGAGAAAWNMIHGIPEPSSLGLTALAVFGGLARWRPKRRRKPIW